jgi:hypothetical protein
LVELNVPYYDIKQVDTAMSHILKIVELDYKILKDAKSSGAVARSMQNFREDLGKLYGYASLKMRMKMKELEHTEE